MRAPFPALSSKLTASHQLPEAAADHRGSRGPAHAGHPGPGDVGVSPAAGAVRSHQLCGTAAETGKKKKKQQHKKKCGFFLC